MIAHAGESIIIGSVFKAINGSFNLADYEVRCVVTDIKGEKILVIENDDVVRNNADNTVACTIDGIPTRQMVRGLYFVSFELWANGEMVLSNEVEQLTIVD
jgi:hypothetical protein